MKTSQWPWGSVLTLKARQWYKFRFAALAILVGLTLVLSNCAPTTTPSTSTSGTSPVLVYGAGGQPVNLDPGNITDGNSVIVQEQIYDRLVSFKPGTTDPMPSLATAWTATEGGKVWTFNLKQGVTFQDGTDFDADAVLFNVGRWWDPKHPQGFRNAGKTYDIWKDFFGGYRGEANSLLQDLVKVDRYTVKFVLKYPFAAFPAAIGSGYFGMASPAAVKQAGAQYGTAGTIAVGTGPFLFKEWRPGDRIVLTRNPKYWQPGFPKVEQLVIRFITDPAARLAQLRAGQIDFTVDLAPDQAKELQADPNLTAVSRPSFNVGYLALNPSYQPLSDVRVRQAIAHAIHRIEIVRAFWGDLGQTSPHFTPPILDWSHSKPPIDYDFNPQKAKQLLAAAGYPNGFDLDLWYMPVSRPYFPTPKPIAEVMASELGAIGIRVKLQTKDWAAYLADRKRAPGFQAFMLGWTGDFGDPDNFYSPHFGPGSTSDLGGWRNDRVITLLEQGRRTADQAARAKIYAEIDAILQREMVRLPIVHTQPLLAKRKNITGWVPSPLGSEPFETIEKR